MAACPKCGRACEPTDRICPACGVIMSKVRPKTASGPAEPGPTAARSENRVAGRPLPSPPITPVPEAPADSHASPGLALLKVVMATTLVVGALVVINGLQRGADGAAASARWVGAPRAAAPRTAAPPRAISIPKTPEKPPPHTVSAEEVAFLNGLAARFQQSTTATPTEAEVLRVEGIYAMNREDEQLRSILMGVYMRRADHDLQVGSFAQADQTLAKMKSLDSRQAQVYAFEGQSRARQNDWAGALGAVQTYESLSGDATINMSFLLALSLDKVGRSADALAVLARPVFDPCRAGGATSEQAQTCSEVPKLRENILNKSAGSATAANRRAALQVDASKAQIQSERFDIRFDGEDQSGVARDVLFVLDRAYVRLADIYYERPARKISVVLHSQQDYYTKTGAPWWSGGQYSSHTGAIQIPIRGLPKTLPREMEDVLVHELSHAFVDEMAGGVAGRELQEGLAQYMEGKRVEQELAPDEMQRLARSGGRGVMSVYMRALAFTQQLIQSRGQGMVNQLLRSMKDMGSEDGGYRKTFGRSDTEMKTEIFGTFWRRYS